jgi:PAS domain S-box-containing protein
MQSKALDAGANDFLSKNADKVILLARVRSMLKYRRAVEALQTAKHHLSQRVESQAEDLHHVNLVLKSRVAELEELQASSRKTNEQLDQLLASIPCILIGLDGANRITHWNAMAREKFHLTSDRAFGRALFECGIPWDESQVLEAINRCRRTGNSQRIARAELAWADGRKGVLDLNIAPIRDRSKRVTGVLIFGSDIGDGTEGEQHWKPT